jgi:hypothetical protein
MLRSAYIYKVAKSLGFCFKQGKEKTKQKVFAMRETESKRQFAPVLFIAQPLAQMLSISIPEINIRHVISS